MAKVGRPFKPMNEVRRQGRNGDMVQISLRVPSSVYWRVRKASEYTGMTYSEVITELVNDAYGIGGTHGTR